MNGYLLRLLKTGRTLSREEHEFTGFLPCPAELVCPGATLEAAALAFIARVNGGSPAEGELVLHLEAGARVEAGDLIFTGAPAPLYVRRLGSQWTLV